jgi:hypothetical protein
LVSPRFYFDQVAAKAAFMLGSRESVQQMIDLDQNLNWLANGFNRGMIAPIAGPTLSE